MDYFLIFIILFFIVVAILLYKGKINKGELSLGKYVFCRFEANSQETRVLKEKIEKEGVSTIAALTTLEKEFDIMKPWNLLEDLKIIKKISREERNAAFRLGLYASGKRFNNAGNVKIDDESYSWDEN